MRRLTVILIAILALVWWARAHAQAGDNPVVLTDGQGKFPLGLHMELLEDPGGDLTIEDVSSPEYDSRFILSQVEAPNYGFTESVYWVRLHLRNESRLTDRWLLDVGFANMHFVELYTPLADGDGFEVKQTGSRRSPDTRDILHPRIVLNLTIPSQSESTVYLRLKNGAPMILPITLWQPDAFADKALEEQMVTGVFFGVVLGLLFYHLFLFFSLREAPYLYLVLLLIGVAAYEASQANYLDLYLMPNAYQLKQHIIAIASALILISIVLLHDSFLTAKKLFPNIYRMDMVLIGIWVVLALFTFVTDYHDLAVVMSPMIVVTLSASSLALIAAWPRGFRANRALIIALLGLFASILLFILGRLGVISNVTITENLFRVGFVSLAVCWSLALAERVNNLKFETEAANLELQNSERRLKQILEGLPFGVVVYGKDQKPTFVNRRIAEILGNPTQGIEPDLSAGRTLAEAMKYYSIRVAGSDQDYPLEKLPVYRALLGETATVDDAEADLLDRKVPLEIWASPVMDDAGDIESAVVAFQDITERRQMDAELTEYREQLESLVKERTRELKDAQTQIAVLFDSSPLGIALAQLDGSIVGVNRALKRMTGYSEDELLNINPVKLFTDPEQQTRIQEHLSEFGNVHDYGVKLRRRDGSLYYANLNLSRLGMAGQELLLGIVDDVTDQVEIKEALTTLHNISYVLSSIADLPTLLNHALEHLYKIVDFDRAALMLVEEGGESLTIHAYIEPNSPPEFTVNHIPISRFPSIQAILEKRETVFVTDMLDSKIIQADLENIENSWWAGALKSSRSWLSLPLVVGERTTGLLNILHGDPNRYKEEDVDLAQTFANQLAVAINNIQLKEQTRLVAAEKERSRIARDLHDSVTQVLFSASLVAEVLPQIWRRNPERALDSIAELRRLTRGALAEMRTLLLELRPTSVIKTPLPELLAQLTEAITARIELPFNLYIEQTPPLPEEAHIGFYRIAQEALNNVVKHAQANQVTVSLSAKPISPVTAGGTSWVEEPGGLQLKWARAVETRPAANVGHEVKLVIEDDGVGFSPGYEGQEHLGFDIMRERALAIQANLSLNSQPGAGTQVILVWRGNIENNHE